MGRNARASHGLLSSLLREVSRSFYLTLRVLPSRIRPQIGLAYLLARASDTIADTELVPLEERMAALGKLRRCIAELKRGPLDLSSLSHHQGSPAERVLIERSEEALALLQSMEIADQQRIQQVLATIISGQELDLQRFGGADAGHITALQTDTELDDYTYRVAGCVGEFWTQMCRAHLFPDIRLEDSVFLANGVRFGKGLQLINILRDVAADLRHGRCYLPAAKLKTCGLTPTELLQPENESRLRTGYDSYLRVAEGHLMAGWAYTHTVPRKFIRVRLACAWPLLIGRETLFLLERGKVLDPNHRIKVNRSQVRRILWRSVVFYPWPNAWRRLFPTAPDVPRQ